MTLAETKTTPKINVQEYFRGRTDLFSISNLVILEGPPPFSFWQIVELAVIRALRVDIYLPSSLFNAFEQSAGMHHQPMPTCPSARRLTIVDCEHAGAFRRWGVAVKGGKVWWETLRTKFAVELSLLFEQHRPKKVPMQNQFRHYSLILPNYAANRNVRIEMQHKDLQKWGSQLVREKSKVWM